MARSPMYWIESNKEDLIEVGIFIGLSIGMYFLGAHNAKVYIPNAEAVLNDRSEMLLEAIELYNKAHSEESVDDVIE